ncbi:hypothetical protein BDW75DRAFT_49392 [Aspergillus navahoensis]
MYAGLPAERQIQTCSRSQSPTRKMKAHFPRRGATLHRSYTTKPLRGTGASVSRILCVIPARSSAMDVVNIPPTITSVASRSQRSCSGSNA